MRNLIRHILKEETNNSKTFEKGINLVMKLIKESYPYIIGWEFGKNGKFSIEINIICDIEKLKEFYNSDLNPYHKRYQNELSNEDYPYPVSILKIRDKMTNDEMFEDYKKLKQGIS